MLIGGPFPEMVFLEQPVPAASAVGGGSSSSSAGGGAAPSAVETGGNSGGASANASSGGAIASTRSKNKKRRGVGRPRVDGHVHAERMLKHISDLDTDEMSNIINTLRSRRDDLVLTEKHREDFRKLLDTEPDISKLMEDCTMCYEPILGGTNKKGFGIIRMYCSYCETTRTSHVSCTMKYCDNGKPKCPM